MARLIFSNVPTATGGVISGNIGVGAGSPFGEGGKYEAQVANIKATIAKAPKGFYDPVGWDDFLRKEELYSDQLPEGVRFYGADSPEIMEELLQISTARYDMYAIDRLSRTNEIGGRVYGSLFNDAGHRKKRQDHYDSLAITVNHLMMKKNAPLIQAIEQQERQLEIDQAVKIAHEQRRRETAKPKPKPTPTYTPTPEPTPTTPVSTISILPIIIIAVALIGILLFLRRRK